ncbi:MAG: glucosamine-6-phosphate deaminase [Elusimicrobiaceae bacterium]|nr:glucosamine-6-phosphate deaminase [Elusimicrobiaceae bacterium]
MYLIETEDNIGFLTASYIKNRIKSFVSTKDNPYFVLALPTGGTAINLYGHLVKFYKEGLSFDKVVTFNLDEYVGLSENHPQSYHSFMFKNLFNHIKISKEQINILNGNAANLEQECTNYEEKMKKYGGIDLFIGGIGRNGHIAFNEPGSAFNSKTRVVDLTPNTISANARFFNDDISQVPTRALTMGLGTIMSAKEVIIMATGAKKSQALYHAFEDKQSTSWPVTVLQKHPRTFIIADKAAAAEISKTTKRDCGLCSFIN